MALRIPLHDPDFYTTDPHSDYRRLRREAPVYWHEECGWWALAKYKDVRLVSIHPELFTSTQGIMIPDEGAITPDTLDLMIFTDPPRHRKLRTVMKTRFTPGHVMRLEPRIREVARRLVDGIERGPVIDFAGEIAAPLPTVVIAEVIGAPPEDWERFRAWSDAVIGYDDPDAPLRRDEAQVALHEYFSGLIEARQREPRDDLLSSLLASEVDGQKLSWNDVYNFCWLLLIAGNETTRNLIALGTRALLSHPNQLQKLVDTPSLIGSAVEEMLRWANPVSHMVRTATQDVEIRGQKILEGQRVVMLYGSANRDEEIFGPDAEEFDVTRNPNPHIQFGFGEHVCIGSALARLEARVMFEELVPILASATLAGDVTRVRSTMVPGVRHMPVQFSAQPAAT
jgi:cytochrome P450